MPRFVLGSLVRFVEERGIRCFLFFQRSGHGNDGIREIRGCQREISEIKGIKRTCT